MIQINAVVISENNDSVVLLDRFAAENYFLLKIVGNASSTVEGIEMIKQKKPAVVFIDIFYKDDSFFEVMNQLDFNAPKLILISQYENDAVKAFKYNAIDFIFKPIEFNKVILSLYKVAKRIEMEESNQQEKIRNIATLNAGKDTNEYVAIASLDKKYFFRIHHSYIINISQICKISKKDGFFCEMPDGIILPVAKRRQEDFNVFIGLKE